MDPNPMSWYRNLRRINMGPVDWNKVAFWCYAACGFFMAIGLTFMTLDYIHPKAEMVQLLVSTDDGFNTSSTAFNNDATKAVYNPKNFNGLFAMAGSPRPEFHRKYVWMKHPWVADAEICYKCYTRDYENADQFWCISPRDIGHWECGIKPYEDKKHLTTTTTTFTAVKVPVTTTVTQILSASAATATGDNEKPTIHRLYKRRDQHQNVFFRHPWWKTYNSCADAQWHKQGKGKDNGEEIVIQAPFAIEEYKGPEGCRDPKFIDIPYGTVTAHTTEYIAATTWTVITTSVPVPSKRDL